MKIIRQKTWFLAHSRRFSRRARLSSGGRSHFIQIMKSLLHRIGTNGNRVPPCSRVTAADQSRPLMKAEAQAFAGLARHGSGGTGESFPCRGVWGREAPKIQTPPARAERIDKKGEMFKTGQFQTPPGLLPAKTASRPRFRSQPGFHPMALPTQQEIHGAHPRHERPQPGGPGRTSTRDIRLARHGRPARPCSRRLRRLR